MNNINQWHEVISALELESFKHEEAVRLMREADLPNPGLFERIGMTLKDILGGFRGQLQKQQPVARHASRATTQKYVT
jgi:hypothetical protein